jgi:uncharacterized protein (DUF2141 family)
VPQAKLFSAATVLETENRDTAVKTAWLQKLWVVGGLVALTGSTHGATSPGHGEIVFSVATSGNRGNVVCGLYDRSGWLKRPLRKTVVPSKGNVATCQFEGLAPGRYAAGGFQDQNSNGKLDRGWTGLPKEPWCLSRGPRGTVSAPPFDAAAFALGDGRISLSCRAK